MSKLCDGKKSQERGSFIIIALQSKVVHLIKRTQRELPKLAGCHCIWLIRLGKFIFQTIKGATGKYGGAAVVSEPDNMRDSSHFKFVFGALAALPLSMLTVAKMLNWSQTYKQKADLKNR